MIRLLSPPGSLHSHVHTNNFIINRNKESNAEEEELIAAETAQALAAVAKQEEESESSPSGAGGAGPEQWKAAAKSIATEKTKSAVSKLQDRKAALFKRKFGGKKSGDDGSADVVRTDESTEEADTQPTKLSKTKQKETPASKKLTPSQSQELSKEKFTSSEIAAAALAQLDPDREPERVPIIPTPPTPQIQLDPTFETFDLEDKQTMEIGWQLTPAGIQEIGLVLLFHGCSHSASTWWRLAEDRKISKQLLLNGFSLLAFSSRDRHRKCWHPAWPETWGADNQDVIGVLTILKKWLVREKRQHLPMLAYGGSSGGTFVTILARAMHLVATVVLISPGDEDALSTLPAREHADELTALLVGRMRGEKFMPVLDAAKLKSAKSTFNLSPMLFIYMTRDTQWASASAIESMKSVILSKNPWFREDASARLPLRVDSIAVPPTAITIASLIDMFDALNKQDFVKQQPHCLPLWYHLAHVSLPKDLLSQETAVPGMDYVHDNNDIIIDATTHQLTQDPRSYPFSRLLLQRMYALATSLSRDKLEKFFHDPTPSTFTSPLSLPANGNLADILTNCASALLQQEDNFNQYMNERWAAHEQTSREVHKMIQWMKLMMLSEEMELKKLKNSQEGIPNFRL